MCLATLVSNTFRPGKEVRYACESGYLLPVTSSDRTSDFVYLATLVPNLFSPEIEVSYARESGYSLPVTYESPYLIHSVLR